MIRRPPRSTPIVTLFPSTTLFRSMHHLQVMREPIGWSAMTGDLVFRSAGGHFRGHFGLRVDRRPSEGPGSRPRRTWPSKLSMHHLQVMAELIGWSAMAGNLVLTSKAAHSCRTELGTKNTSLNHHFDNFPAFFKPNRPQIRDLRLILHLCVSFYELATTGSKVSPLLGVSEKMV